VTGVVGIGARWLGGACDVATICFIGSESAPMRTGHLHGSYRGAMARRMTNRPFKTVCERKNLPVALRRSRSAWVLLVAALKAKTDRGQGPRARRASKRGIGCPPVAAPTFLGPAHVRAQHLDQALAPEVSGRTNTASASGSAGQGKRRNPSGSTAARVAGRSQILRHEREGCAAGSSGRRVKEALKSMVVNSQLVGR